MALNSDDFPDPTDPVTTTNSPFATEKFKSKRPGKVVEESTDFSLLLSETYSPASMSSNVYQLKVAWFSLRASFSSDKGSWKDSRSWASGQEISLAILLKPMIISADMDKVVGIMEN
ncbi:hypothetical protein OGAPHI_001369 [Ogataea philodendri]|uniref:Uncharacterized protein n=1 Tax=Ogataea philodendri TaxID=1378263 RepID=A0A9P8PBJ3_9ASCO|nr:uncharacterized protein OGAPHI_001369 [Ogataea philodendri]KAH3669248.1 hypothetical protein OGAPHI_001369 [Ogataea philodendri]